MEGVKGALRLLLVKHQASVEDSHFNINFLYTNLRQLHNIEN